LLPDSFEISKASRSPNLRFSGTHSLLRVFTLEHFNVKLQFPLNVELDVLSVLAHE
jgi:hypothetical protein